jgi:hypothetical protein
VSVAFRLNILTLTHLYVIAVVTGAGTMVFNVAYQSYLPSLVGRGGPRGGQQQDDREPFGRRGDRSGLGGALVQGIGAARALRRDCRRSREHRVAQARCLQLNG